MQSCKVFAQMFLKLEYRLLGTLTFTGIQISLKYVFFGEYLIKELADAFHCATPDVRL